MARDGRAISCTPLLVVTVASVACAPAGHQARYQPFLMLAMTSMLLLRWITIDRTAEPTRPASSLNASPLASEPLATAVWIWLGVIGLSGARTPPIEPTKDTDGPSTQALPPDRDANTAAV